MTVPHLPPQRSAAVAAITGALLALAGCNSGNSEPSPAPNPEPTPAPAEVAKCEQLNGQRIEAALIGEPSGGAHILSAVYRDAVPDRLNDAGTAMQMGTPAYCELKAEILPLDPQAPVINSQINLPTDWNGKKLQYGGSGYNGTLVTGLDSVRNAPDGTPLPLTRGYMTAGTDSGHQNTPGVEPQAFALNDEALTNFAYAAYKKTHDLAVVLGERYYGRQPTRSYYMGGSEGGREALVMAQRYPADYDGIISIDPVLNWSGLQTFGNYVGGILQARPEGWLGETTQQVHNAVRQACDALDGIEDGVVSDYLSCREFAPQALLALACEPSMWNDERRRQDAAPPADCLSNAQMSVLETAYSGYSFDFELAHGMREYIGFSFGGEALPGNWSRWMSGDIAPVFEGAPNVAGIGNLFNYGNGYVRYFIAQDKDFDPLQYNPNDFVERVLAVSALMDATDPDLAAFQARGGKLILRENMADGAQSPLNGLLYWNRLGQIMGQDVRDSFFAAYAATGLPHTSSGVAPGTPNAPAYGIPGQIDLLTQLENWVEQGQVPAEKLNLTLSERLPPYATLSSKPMCRVPLIPYFPEGADPTKADQAESYVCVNRLT